MKYQKLNDLVRLEHAHIELGARMMRPTSRAEELIADLEAEIVKRDARISELEMQNHDLLDRMKVQQRGGVVLPERANENEGNSYAVMQAMARNQALDEVARLNPPGECVAVPRELLESAAHLLSHTASYVAVTRGEAVPNDFSKLSDQLRALLAQHGKAVES